MANLQILDLEVSSGKSYIVDEDGFALGSIQYIDRDYTFDYVPDIVKDCIHIRTAGDDKLIDENNLCFRFRVTKPVRVFIIYADKYHHLPAWLLHFHDTRQKITRHDSNTTTLKGIFSLFAKDYAPGVIDLNGNLSKDMASDPQFKINRPLGANYCMYSVIVKENISRNVEDDKE